jgi:hypothetical protein
LGFNLDEVVTYPTMSAVMPEEMLAGERLREQLAKLDEVLANECQGAYIIVTGTKR